jgi:hypothetical protein
LACVVVNPPLRSVQVVPSQEPTPNPMKIVEGGPADVSVRLIAWPDNVTVNGFASLPPTCTVPEKFSVVAGVVGAVGKVDVEVAALVEQPAVASAQAARRPTMDCFTATPLEDFYVSEPWRPGDKSDKSNALTA